MTQQKRYCPLCDEWLGVQVCPVHSTPTVAEATILESETTTLDEGLTLAGRYRIGRLLGEGGMGAVYEAHEERMGRKVALKILTRSRLKDPVHLRRFYREARAAGSLEHPSIVRVYDFGVDDDTGFPYIAMECLDGLPLQRLLDETGPMSEARAAHLVLQVAQALTEAHAKGIVHRDLKPENLIVRRLSDGSQQVKVLDFGVAKIRSLNDEQLQTLTAEGVPIGTPLYMSPEQAKGGDTDFRSDLYALGFILYRLLSGQAAMADANPLGTLIRQVVEAEPKLPRVLADGTRPSDAVVDLYHSLVAKDPAHRPPSTTAVVERLQSIIRLAEASTLDETNPPAPIPTQHLPAFPVDPTDPPAGVQPVGKAQIEDGIGSLGTAPLPLFAEEEMSAGGSTLRDLRVSPPKGPGVGLWVVAALSVAAVGAWSLWPGGDGVAPPSVTAVDVAPTRVTGPGESKGMKEAPSGEAAAPNTAQPQPSVRTIRITSGPSGATVHRGDLYLGETPLDYAVKVDGAPIDLRFRIVGYPPQRRIVNEESLVHVAFRRPGRPAPREAVPAAAAPRASTPPKAKAARGPNPKPKPKPTPDAGRKLPTW